MACPVLPVERSTLRTATHIGTTSIVRRWRGQGPKENPSLSLRKTLVFGPVGGKEPVWSAGRRRKVPESSVAARGMNAPRPPRYLLTVVVASR